jgi:glycosyltransferase involved in cell wall biosynthesis
MIRLAKGLESSGYLVTVYADIGLPSYTFNLIWRHCNDNHLDADVETCDLLVSSRWAAFPGCEARKANGLPSWLWMHDLHIGADWANAIAKNFNQVICLSKFAKARFKDYYPKVKCEVVVIPNGVSPELFDKQRFLEQHARLARGEESLRVIWSSSPDRGFDRVLALWPLLLAQYPGARLDVYGAAEEVGQPGVVVHGKVGQVELAEAWQRAHLWLYPTSFEETSCITAMEAQIAGTKVVCTAVGALPETVNVGRFVPVFEPTESWAENVLETIAQTLASTHQPSMTAAYLAVPTWGAVASAWTSEIEWEVGRKPSCL